jgi:histidinol phosphatase-like PHP family hydrolase
LALMSQPCRISRRGFLGAVALSPLAAAAAPSGVPRVDYHVHLDKVVTLEKALEISKQRGVKFGIVEHAGTTRNNYPGLISTDADLVAYIAKLEGKPVFKGIQAECLDWMTCFSKEAVAKLDYVLSDALTLPEKNGQLTRIWTPFTMGDKQEWMDRYTDHNVQVIATEPIDIMANPTFLPESIQPEYHQLWTEARMRKIIHAAVKYHVAIEINSRYRVPSLKFLKMAKAAGATFSFGSNVHDVGVGNIDYCLEMAEALGLTGREVFKPAPAGRKPIQTRRLA